MKNKLRPLLLAALAVSPWLTAPALRAQTPAAPTPAAPRASDLDIELGVLIGMIKARLQSGVETEADLEPQLKKFDALLEAHRHEKTDAVAQIPAAKAMVYLQVFRNFEKSAALFQLIKKEFPDTTVGKDADRLLAEIARLQEIAKIQAALVPGAVFPDFAEKDLDGAPLSIARFKGKVVLVDFWATWCGPCLEELPAVQAAYKKYRDKGLEIVGISLDQSEETLRKFIKESAMTWPQYFDGKVWEGKLPATYGINSIPATFLLDRDGKIVARDLRGPDLEAALAKLLGTP